MCCRLAAIDISTFRRVMGRIIVYGWHFTWQPAQRKNSGVLKLQVRQTGNLLLPCHGRGCELESGWYDLTITELPATLRAKKITPPL